MRGILDPRTLEKHHPRPRDEATQQAPRPAWLEQTYDDVVLPSPSSLPDDIRNRL